MSKPILSQNYMENILTTRKDSLLFARYAYNLLADKKNVDKAQKIASEGVLKAPDFATGRFVLALCLTEQKEYDLALMQLYEVLKIEPTYQAAIDQVIKILTMTDNIEDALEFEDYLARLNPKSHFLGKKPNENYDSNTIYEIFDKNGIIHEFFGSKLNWREFASEKYLNINNKEQIIDKQTANEFIVEINNENNFDDIGNDIIAELELQENINIPKDVFNKVTMSVNDDKLNDETDYDETSYEKELEKFTDIYDDFANSSFVDAIDEKTCSYTEEDFKEFENPQEIKSDSQSKESEFNDFKNLIEETITTLPLEDAIPQQHSKNDYRDTFETAEYSMEELQSLMPEKSNKNNINKKEDDKAELENKPANVLNQTAEFSLEEIQRILHNTNEEDDKITGEDIDNALDKFFNEEPNRPEEISEYQATVMENPEQKLNEEEQKAEPISEKEAFAEMLAKNGTDLLPNHILTPTFAQIYLEQEQPFLAKQIYERLLENDSENEEYLEKLSEINKIIEKIKNGESILVKPKIIKREKPKTDVTKINKKSLKGKRISKEIREAMKEKHSANSKESNENSDDKI